MAYPVCTPGMSAPHRRKDIDVLSGGSEPGSVLNPMAVVDLNEVGIDIKELVLALIESLRLE